MTNNRTGKKTKVPRLVRMHAAQMVDVASVGPGEICAMFGLECQSGDAFGNGSHRLLLESMCVLCAVWVWLVSSPVMEGLLGWPRSVAEGMEPDWTLTSPRGLSCRG